MKEEMVVFLGSYANAEDSGVYVCSYDAALGQLTLLQEISGLQNPTFLDVDVEGSKIYVLSEMKNEQGQRIGSASSFNFDQQTQRLTKLNTVKTTDASTCHITLDRMRRNIIVSSYHGGMVGVSPLNEDGAIGKIADVHHHGEGSGVAPAQTQARAHSVFLDRRGRYAIACDLGQDRLVVYEVDSDQHKLLPLSRVATAPGSGPRHFAFHPSGAYGYVINELNSTITAYRYNEENGELSEIQSISTLPQDYDGENGCADIHISPDGRFLYGSNRGHDSIAVFSIDLDTGKLNPIEYTSTKGGHPRNFAISPDGRFVLVANRDGNNVVTFERNSDTGKLSYTGCELTVSKPVCVRFFAK